MDTMDHPPHFYHVVTPEQWGQFSHEIFYEDPSLQNEGFIHASTEAQVTATMNRYFKGEPIVLLLKIEAARLTSELKYELAPSVNDYFPHIYGPINKDAVREITVIYAAEDGSFTFI
ncbi:MAG: DUF952 domain-containing protein [Chitinophagaceae bacterium]